MKFKNEFQIIYFNTFSGESFDFEDMLGYIDAGDECCGQFMLLTSLTDWWPILT